MVDDSPDNSNTKTEDIGKLEKSRKSDSVYPEEGKEGVGNESDTESDEIAERELDIKKIRNFFKKKGAVEILAQLANGPKRFSEIDNALVVSHGTVASRLTEGAKIGIWKEYFEYPDDGGKIKLYQLNPETKKLADIAKHKNITKTTKRKRHATQQHADAVSNFQDEI